MANDGTNSMQSDHYLAELLGMMREQGSKDNPVTLQLGVMQSANSVKVDDLVLYAEDLYIADYLRAGYTRTLRTPYVYDVRGNILSIEQDKTSYAVFSNGLKRGDLVAVQRLYNTNKYVILAKVVEA